MSCTFDLKKTAQSIITLCYDKELQMKRVLKTRTQSRKLSQSNELSIAHLLSQEPHRNVARYYNGTRTEKGFKLAMQFYENGDLLEFQKQNKMSAQLTQKFVHDIVHGLSHLHSLGIAHRDISLENVLLDKHFRSHLSGFSLAVENGAECTESVSKAFYTAPEVSTSSCYDGFQSDMWSLGILLLILVTNGNVPFVHASANGKNYQRFLETGVRKYLDSCRIPVSEACIDLIEQLLQVDPIQRPSIEQVVSHPFLKLQVREKKTTTSVVKRKKSFRALLLKFKRRHII